MPRPRSAGVRERGGKLYARVATGPRTESKSRKSVYLPTCSSWEEAEARAQVIFEIVERLRAAGQTEFLEKIVEQAGAAPANKLPALLNVVAGIVSGSEKRPSPALADAITFQAFAEQWTKGELNAMHPDHIAEKRTSRFDKYRLERHVYPVVGNIPLVAFRLQNAEEVMRRIPRKLSTASRRQIAQLLRRVMQLAEYPSRIIEHSPIPRGFLPKVTQTKALAYLYPDEDAKLLACSGAPGVPLVHRLLYGVLAREGLRSNEALTLCWSDLDLDRGAIRLDTNKTDDPRAWALNASVAEALRRWRALHPKTPKPSTLVFHGLEASYRLAEMFREHLTRAKVERPELFEDTDSRRPIRIHDLRATFVTLSLAAGRSEAWVASRTGHRSSQMINRYRRAARTVEELGLGSLGCLVEAIPELAGEWAPKAPRMGATVDATTARTPPNPAPPREFPRRDSNSDKWIQNASDHVTGGAGDVRNGVSVERAGTHPDAPSSGEQVGAHSAPNQDGYSDAVEDALAKALEAAIGAGRFDVVAQLARELEARRLTGGTVIALRTTRTGRRSVLTPLT